MRSHLTNRLQHCKINDSFNEWEKRTCWYSSRFTLRSLLIDIVLNDIFLFLQWCDLANYAYDSTIYTSNKSISNIIVSLSHEFTVISIWLYNNFMVLNPNECSFMVLGLDDGLQTVLVVEMKLFKKIIKKKY